MNRVSILGVPVDPLMMTDAVSQIRTMLDGSVQRHIMTPNNEMLVEAHAHESFRAVLQRTALNLPDSTGLLWAATWTNQTLPERVTGVDTVAALCTSLDGGVPVFFLGAAEGVAAKAAVALRAQNPAMVIAGAYAGSPRDSDAQDILGQVNASGAKLLLVAYGSPAQDLWIDRYLREMPSVRVAIGVGGTFDFIAGTKKRAPVWMRSAGLEWLYRFIQEPSRWRRMWNAVIVFPYYIITRGGSPRD